jgi:diadenosine tetraphosphate (Ap4A) HIT family hydrolase
MTAQDHTKRRALEQRCAALIAQGMCPACHQWATGEVFPGQQEQTYYQDALLACHLETYPRGVGHTMLVSRAHYADIAEMPIDLGCHIVRVTHAVVKALKRVGGATKVDRHTLCSGELSHWHLQCIPRRPGDLIGGRVFAAECGVLTDYQGLLQARREEVRIWMR